MTGLIRSSTVLIVSFFICVTPDQYLEKTGWFGVWYRGMWSKYDLMSHAEAGLLNDTKTQWKKRTITKLPHVFYKLSNSDIRLTCDGLFSVFRTRPVGCSWSWGSSKCAHVYCSWRSHLLNVRSSCHLREVVLDRGLIVSQCGRPTVAVTDRNHPACTPWVHSLWCQKVTRFRSHPYWHIYVNSFK